MYLFRRVLYVWLVGLLTSSSETRLSRERVPHLTSDNFTCFHIEIERGDQHFCVSQSGDRTHHTLTKSRAFYRLSCIVTKESNENTKKKKIVRHSANKKNPSFFSPFVAFSFLRYGCLFIEMNVGLVVFYCIVYCVILCV